MSGHPCESEIDWVLVLAPFRKDADYIAALLREQRVEVVALRGSEDVAHHLARSPGVIVIAHEALNPQIVASISEHLAGQPDWSEVPILVLLERAASIAKIRTQLERAWSGSRLLFHTRPIAQLELVNSIQSNLLVRLRQRQVRDAIDRERELRLELNHRIKNILASVSSIFQMTQRGATTLEGLSSEFKGRLQALSDVHSAVFEAGGEDVFLSSVVELTVAPYNTRTKRRINVRGPEIAVGRDAATTIALCLHELITNAVKYGALSNGEGSVDIVWDVCETDEPVFTLDWAESDGPEVSVPSRQGYGTRYVRSALGSLCGSTPEISFARGGFKCHVSGPLRRLATW